MDATITTQISKLRAMSLTELQAKYAEIFGKQANSESRNREWLFKTIARKLQDGAGEEVALSTIPAPTLTVKFEPKKQARAKGTAKAGKKATPKPRKPKRPGKPATKTAAKPLGARDPRLPKPGTTITREWHGKKYLVRVLDQGFEFEGKPYRSLSALAKHITGQIVNGFAWFRVGAKESKKS